MKIKINMKIIRGILVYLLFEFYYLSKYIPYTLFHIDGKDFTNNYTALSFLILFTSLVLLFILLIIYRKDLIEDWKIYKANKSQNFDTGLIYWTLGLIIMVVSNSFLIYVLKLGQAKNENIIQSYIAAAPWIIGLDICIISPITEELVFRKAIKDIFNHPILFVIASTLIFGSAHIYSVATTWTDWLYLIPYGALGGAFALSYQKTNTIYTSITFHMIHNTLIFLLSTFIRG